MPKNNAKEAQSPMKGQWPNPKKIACKDCKHRDKTFVEIDGEKIFCGITKSFCDVYRKPPESNGKPHDVLFLNEDCEFFEKE